jgi:hypothetical protein
VTALATSNVPGGRPSGRPPGSFRQQLPKPLDFVPVNSAHDHLSRASRFGAAQCPNPAVSLHEMPRWYEAVIC